MLMMYQKPGLKPTTHYNEHLYNTPQFPMPLRQMQGCWSGEKNGGSKLVFLVCFKLTDSLNFSLGEDTMQMRGRYRETGK